MINIYKSTSAAIFVIAATFTTGVYASPVQGIQDQQLIEEVQTAIGHNPDLRADTLHDQAEDGVVYISGEVDTTLEHMNIDDLAAKLPGVKSVVNETSVGNN